MLHNLIDNFVQTFPARHEQKQGQLRMLDTRLGYVSQNGKLGTEYTEYFIVFFL